MAYGRSTVERRQLGLTLRKLRERHGLSQDEAGSIIGRKQTRISRAENGVGSLSQDEIAALLDFYGVDSEERTTILALGGQARKRQRGRAYTDQLPWAFERLADLQAEASAISSYDTGIVPGLAQSPDYVAAAIRAGDGVWWESSEAEVQRRITFRLDQQARVLDCAEPKELSFVLTETALDQVVGDISVLRGQMEHLLALGRRAAVDVRVLPKHVPGNPLLGGGLLALDFGGAAPPIVFVSSHGPSTCHDQVEATAPMFGALARVRELALSPEESSEFLFRRLEVLSG